MIDRPGVLDLFCGAGGWDVAMAWHVLKAVAEVNARREAAA